ncbi:hypothetical protein E4T38_08547 [Aureobasidium subglaciale]|nr:hypothetical protein E4T38_08547 [Aureobasidium subglaciale]KAI5215233.1 hypothetical protein E4T40_08519 [Aureobasidium subglaciale]KAI5218424.1 hypothetical protein E4T41_08372 [Aureobasidium subglaciale]KAI5256048.1 hypothetical protein E4T46_08407 [Aureobasidium subglaciale]
MTNPSKSEVSQDENKKSPKWIEVEDLKAYYATHDPPGRKYPAPTDAEFEDFHIDASAGIIQDDGPTAGQMKEAARLARKPSGKSIVKSGAQADAKAAVTAKPPMTNTKKVAYEGKGKGKKVESSDEEDEEEEGEEEDEKMEPKEDPNAKRYKNCNECYWSKVKCEPSEESGDDGARICERCVEKDLQCHISIVGTRPVARPSWSPAPRVRPA